MATGFMRISLFIVILLASIKAYGMEKRIEATDFEIYKLLHAAQHMQSSQDFSLPTEIIQAIALTAFKHRCITHHAKQLNNPTAISNFISNNLNKSVNHTVIIALLKTCLAYTGKSLCDIKNKFGQTVLHDLLYSNKKNHSLACIQIICSVAQSDAWKLIISQDISDSNALHLAYRLNNKERNELLKFAPNEEESLSAMNKKNNSGNTPQHNIISFEYCKRLKKTNALNYRKQKATAYNSRKTNP